MEPPKPNPDTTSVLFDVNKSASSVEIPRLEHVESEPFEPDTFSEMQTQAWWMYIRGMVSKHMNRIDESPHVSESEAISWLDGMLGAVDPSGSFTRRMVPRKYVPTKTLAKVEIVLPRSAAIYFWGPDLSVLWGALAGSDDGEAMERFRVLSGLTNNEICKCPPEFLETLLDCHEPIALHALAAMVSAFGKRIESTGGDIREMLLLLHQGLSLELRNLQRLTDDAELCEAMADPWFQRSLVCLHHDATIGRLSLYGLARQDLLGVRGKATTSPPKGQSFKFSFSSDVVDTIKVERGDIPRNVPLQRMPPMPEDNKDWVTLGTCARYWHNKMHE